MPGTLPPDIRVNTQVPFPALVVGGGPITVTKQNGVWQVGFSIAVFSQIFGVLPGLARPQRSVTVSPIVIQGIDQILNVNIATGAVVCTLPPFAGRLGVPLTFKDVGGNFVAHPLTITAAGTDLIDGQPSITLNGNHEYITLVPANDTVNTGWSIM
jgi:hypothetical protein